MPFLQTFAVLSEMLWYVFQEKRFSAKLIMAAGKKGSKSKASAAKKKEVVPSNENAQAKDAASEINARRWSVVSFESVAAKNLTYNDAVKKLKRLEAKKIAGLCIVTNEAAAKISK